MNKLRNGLLTLLVAAAPISGLAEDAGDKSQHREFFTKRIEPLLRKHCYECHSHGVKKAKGGLVLDSRSGWETGGESGPAIDPGKPEDSLLISAVKYEGLEMPPSGRLPAELVEQLQKWVKDGAFDPRVTKSARTAKKIDLDTGRKHWAFRALQKTTVPNTKDKAWPRTDADRFVLDRLEKSGTHSDRRRGLVHVAAASQLRPHRPPANARTDRRVCRRQVSPGKGESRGPAAGVQGVR